MKNNTVTRTHEDTIISPDQYTDDALIKDFPGFTNQYATVNGVKLHYVEGGNGTPLICLPG